ncbi:putative homing endonuclease [Campylobacter phage F358]|uniref:Putative homing endonuclease n=8 Tax=Fletchervirus CPX TaxID=1110702 RepID=A0A7T3KG33_9CAUD|nr:putative homing endonuclease [Campylobacter phage F348]QPX63952.1 putative homing endonuclease [Campylobacter phage F357]QPX64115.1 putative homing endonuclease [Campylobacter phage F358]QPX64278.1 putative homing endonuclease [Campylobacter phage F360]QPX64444.1 putative homing endonuclease [Campylobacter phage F361]QPX64607.1 putative homing endonuclease [Campylobacter phage F365]QPX64772.1 putative homing endonuclease [Campylobacter phage F367]QPX64936.1 putative homing endonuclease [C
MTLDEKMEFIKSVGFDIIAHKSNSITLQCNYGHVFNKKVSNIIPNTNITCDKCVVMSKEKTLMELGFTPLLINGDKCTVKCDKCNHIFNRTWYAFNTRKNTKCPECVEAERWNNINSHLNNMKVSYISDIQGNYTLQCKNGHIFKQCIAEIIKEVGCYQCEVEYRKEYIRNLNFTIIEHNSKIFNVKCNKCNHIFTRDWNGFYNRKHTTCPNCIEIEKKNLAKKHGFTLTDTKCGNDTREFICDKCNATFKRGWSSFTSRGNNECYNCKQLSRISLAKSYGLDIINENITSKYTFKCNKGHVFERPFTVVENKSQTKCPICYPRTSNFEIEVKNFLTELCIKYIQNDRNMLDGLELDFYLPDYNLAIECNGDYWHSDSVISDKKYHLNKTLKCNSQGIQLLHIFESNWIKNRNIWESIIKNKLGLSFKIYARKCEIKEVNKIEEKEFLNKNHLQGFTGSTVCYGLYYQNELVELMSFGRSRFNKNISWELIRLCTKINVNVIGGASRLLKIFENNYPNQTLLSYSNNLYSNGKIYNTLGFEFSHTSSPGYFYYKNGIIYDRQQFMKHKLKDKLEKFNPNLTEAENMSINGYNRVWDCGQGVWVKGSI